MRKIINHPTLALLAGAGTLVALLAASPVQAASHHSAEWHAAHYIRCFNLLGTPQHDKICGSGTPIAAGLASAWNFTSAGDVILPVATKTDDCVPPPCWTDRVEKEGFAKKSFTKKSFGKKSFGKKSFGKKFSGH